MLHDGALIPDNSNSPAEDYILNDNASSFWVTIGSFSIYIRHIKDAQGKTLGASAKIFAIGEEDGEPIDSCTVKR